MNPTRTGREEENDEIIKVTWWGSEAPQEAKLLCSGNGALVVIYLVVFLSLLHYVVLQQQKILHNGKHNKRTCTSLESRKTKNSVRKEISLRCENITRRSKEILFIFSSDFSMRLGKLFSSSLQISCNKFFFLPSTISMAIILTSCFSSASSACAL